MVSMKNRHSNPKEISTFTGELFVLFLYFPAVLTGIVFTVISLMIVTPFLWTVQRGVNLVSAISAKLKSP